MCYSAKCIWENYMGDCSFPSHIEEINRKYGYVKCATTLNEYFLINHETFKIKKIKQRKDKIILLKTKLLNKSEYI